ncbi:oligosaccharide flippase family protein [Hoeflea alexandrii]|uniref:Oligosaccharide flippase family protein n=1 Tax=Hoeflea alexandrii TaxID=288436 RepID=A0ABT1CSD5_9HYPH|nr:oligosaccharide flippase family protein [Hoeflea alexandrii]MCO6409078.1 oligosaccharide flippase family protein [Hoeflea alexandrii]MCY0151695.1 oligosaccharide flippase family protein [Hoeflea alexandrii]
MNLRKRIVDVLSNKLSSDIAWTMGSFMILAMSGIVINIVVAYFRGTEDLGVFNLAYSVYIIVSQIAALGVHYSVLRYAAMNQENPRELGSMLGSALLVVTVLGLLMAGLVFVSEPLFARAYDSERAARAISYAAFGIALFPASKVLISFLNGLRHMKAFSVLQAARYIMVAAVVTAFSVSDQDFTLASLCFVVAEIVTLAAAVIYIASQRLVQLVRIKKSWLREHTSFGGRSLLAGMFGEINTRVDVLCLGLFLGDREVGIYSFVAMLLDGLYHLLAMVRVNFNPILVNCVRDSGWPEAQRLLRLSKRFIPLIMIALSAIVFAFYWLVAFQLVPERGLQEGTVVLLILLGGLVATSPFIPFDNMMLISGYPGRQTLQQAVAFVVNVSLNLALIPVVGIEGAAIGTASSYLAAVVSLILMTDSRLGWNLLTNRVK